MQFKVKKLHVNAMTHKAKVKFIIHNQICNFQNDESKINVRQTERIKKKSKDTDHRSNSNLTFYCTTFNGITLFLYSSFDFENNLFKRFISYFALEFQILIIVALTLFLRTELINISGIS